MTFNSIYNSSTSLQNAILKLLNGDQTPLHDDDAPVEIINEILENTDDESSSEHVDDIETVQETPIVDEPRQTRALTASEIIYNAMLNDYEKDLNQDLSGGNKAEDMIKNILTGGNAPSSNETPKHDIFEEILDNNQNETSLNGGNLNKPTSFADALTKYKSVKSLADDVSSDSSSSSDNEDEHTSDASDPDEADTNINEPPKEFVPLNSNQTNFMSQKPPEDDDTSDDDSSNSDASSSSNDEFLNPDGKSSKYVNIIKQIKNPVPKKSSVILGGSVTRPKTVTIINAFPYILKANPTSDKE